MTNTRRRQEREQKVEAEQTKLDVEATEHLLGAYELLSRSSIMTSKSRLLGREIAKIPPAGPWRRRRRRSCAGRAREKGATLANGGSNADAHDAC